MRAMLKGGCYRPNKNNKPDIKHRKVTVVFICQLADYFILCRFNLVN